MTKTTDKDIEPTENEELENSEGLEEASVAGDTLKPKSKSAGPDPKSRVEYMKNVIGAMAGMDDEHLQKWHNDSMALVGKEARKIKDGSASKNKASIDMKPSNAVGHGSWYGTMPPVSVKEDLDKLFEADETLTEEAKERLSTLFEAAVTARVIVEKEKMQEEAVKQLDEVASEIYEDMEAKIVEYLDWCTEQFMEDNEVAITSTLRAELADELLESLRDVFLTHFYDIPESKVDVVEELSNKIDELESMLDDAVEEISEYRNLEARVAMEEIVDELSEGLTVMQKEKFEQLVEDVEFEGDFEKFAKKAQIIKEHHFPAQTSAEDNLEELNEESLGDTKSEYVDPTVAAVHKAIKRTSGKI